MVYLRVINMSNNNEKVYEFETGVIRDMAIELLNKAGSKYEEAWEDNEEIIFKELEDDIMEVYYEELNK